MKNSPKPFSRAIIVSSVVASLLIPSLSYSQTLNTSSQDQVAAIGAQLNTIKDLFNALLGKLSGTLGAQVSGGSGLVGAWSFSENSGTSAADASGNGNTASFVGSPTWTTGKNGSAVSLNRTSTLNAGSGAVLDDLGPTTISFWLNPRTLDSNTDVFLGKPNTFTTGATIIHVDSASNQRIGFWDDWTGGDVTANFSQALTTNVWQHIAFTWNGQSNGTGSDVKLYVDGVERAVTTFTGGGTNVYSNAAANLAIGPFDGVMDDLRIYNRALSASEIQTDMNTPVGSSTTPPPPDATAPSQPTNVSGTAVSSSQINLSWTASTDNVGVTGYNIYRNNVQIASVANTSYNDTGLTASTPYTYYIRATDAAGNISAQSTSASATTQSTTPPPTPAPTVSLSASATSVTSGSSSTLTWSSTNATSCTASGAWSGTKATSGTQTLTNLTTTGTYTLSCTGSGGTTNTNVTVSVTAGGGTSTPGVFYISPNGNDSNGGATSGAPFKTFAKAFSVMAGGDELVLLDGVYGAAQGTGYISYLGTGSAQPPSGTSIANQTIVRAQNPGNVTVNGQLFIGRSTRKDSYIKIQGITFEGGGSLYNTSFVTVKDSGFHGGFGVGTNDHSNGNTDNLIEDVWVWTSGARIIAINYRADRNVWRRVIVRGDGCGTSSCSGSGNPNVGVTVYNSRDVSFQNVMVVDRILSGTDSPYGDFATAQHDPGGGLPTEPDYFGRNEWLGTLSMNGPDTAYYFEADNVLTTDPSWTIRNAIAIRPSGGGVNIGLPYNGPRTNVVDGVTAIGVGNDGVRLASGQNTSTVRNIISIGSSRYGINSASTPSYVDVYNSAGGNYNQTTCTTGCKTTNPQSDGATPSLLYPVRVEQGSVLKTTGESGADIGANMIYRYGTDGTHRGDAGYNTLTGTSLWPWPNEARIKAEMCANTTRGFCSTGKRLDGVNNITLTSYIWEALGNPIPSSVYNGSTTPPPTPAPTVSLSASATSVTSGSSSTLTWSSTNATSCTASGAWSGTKATSGTQTLTNLTTTGTYTLSCTGSGGTTNTNVTVSVTAITDTTAPSTPTGLSAISISSSQTNLSWAASTDNVGVAGYRIYRNGTQITTTTGTTYSNTGLISATTYTYTVQAYDAAGNSSAQSGGVSVTTQGTTSPPSTKFVLGDRVQVSSGPLNVRATASASGTLLGSQATGNLGTVVGGPTAADGFNWWNINYDSGADGWSAEDYLVKYTTPPPPPTSTDCSATDVRCVDDTPGTTQEYSTIQAAVNTAVAGDTVLVYGGTYSGFVVSKSGTATSRITIKTTGETVTINQINSNSEGITISNASYVTIEGFTLVGMPSYGLATHGATATNPMRGVIIKNNTVQNSGFVNLYTSNTADSTIEGNTTSGSATSHGIYVANGGSDNVIVRGNRAFNNAKNGIHFNGDISVGGDGYHTGLLVENNVFYNNTSNGFDIDGVGDSTFQNNLAYGNGTNAFRAFQIDAGTGIRNLKIINNTFITPGGGVPIKITEDLGGHTIFNNILIAGGSNGSLVTSNTNFKSANNAVNGTFSSNGGNSLVSLSTWQGSGYDANSFTTTSSALFTNPAANDYTLKIGSSAIDKGIGVFNAVSAPSTDIGNTSRPQGIAYDIGAYEYGSGGTTPPPTPAPTITLSASPTSVTSGSSATLTWSSTNATSCTASGGWSGSKATSGTQTLTNLTATATYTLSCTGSGGTTNQSAIITVTPATDTTAPSTPTNLTASVVSSSQINLTWSASTDNVGVTGYKIYRNGSQLTTVAGTSYNNTGLTASTAYSYTVSAYDAAGNNSAQSTGVSATTQAPPDTTLPSITITTPTSATTYIAPASLITLGGTASDNVGVTQVTWSNSAGGSGTASGTTNWSTAITLVAGTNTITVAARDAAGNIGTDTITVTYTVPDTTAPTVSLTAPTSGSTVSSTITISATASDNVGVAGVQFKLDGVNLGTEDTSSPYSISWNTTTASNGVHTLTGVARDAAGNQTTSGGIAVTVSNITPDVTAPSVPTNLTATAVSSSQIALAWNVSTDPTVTGQVTSGLSGYRIYRGSTQIATTTATSYNNTGLTASTAYTYTVAAYDVAGNVSMQSTSVSTITQTATTIDTTPPTISTVTATNVTSSSTSISWNTNEVATSRVVYGTSVTALNQQVDATQFVTSRTLNLSNLKRRTTYSYRVASADTSGNAATSTTFTFTTSSGKPSKVRNLTATSGSIVLSWDMPQNDFIKNINIYRSTVGYPQTTDPSLLIATLSSSNASQYHDTAVTPGTTYYYVVYAIDDLGVFSDPEQIAFTTAPAPGISNSGGSTTAGTGGGTSSIGGSISGTVAGGTGTTGEVITTTNGGTTSTTGGGTTPTTQPTFPTLTGPFSIGMNNDQVKLLQQMLIKDGSLSGEATGYYGPITQKAVETFQTKYSLVTSGTPNTTGYGLAGPGTRAKLNQLYAQGGNTTDREALIASLRKQLADLTAILQSLIAKLAAIKAARGIQ